MPNLTVDDVQKILSQAIVSLKFATAEAAPGLATTMAGAITESLNEAGRDVAPLTAAVPVQALSVVQVLTIRNTIVEAMGDLHQISAAEKLMTLNWIDIAAVMNAPVAEPESTAWTTTGGVELSTSTGTQSVSQGTGSVPAVTS